MSDPFDGLVSLDKITKRESAAPRSPMSRKVIKKLAWLNGKNASSKIAASSSAEISAIHLMSTRFKNHESSKTANIISAMPCSFRYKLISTKLAMSCFTHIGRAQYQAVGCLKRSKPE